MIKVTGGVDPRYYFGAGEYVSSAWSRVPLSADKTAFGHRCIRTADTGLFRCSPGYACIGRCRHCGAIGTLDARPTRGKRYLLYVNLGSEKLIEYSGGTTHFFHADHLGSPRVRTDMSGSEDASWDNLPFGETRASSGMTGDQHKYTGHMRDDETGNDYAGARYYANRAGGRSSH